MVHCGNKVTANQSNVIHRVFRNDNSRQTQSRAAYGPVGFQRFVHPRLIVALINRRIGVECMDNLAACRTYNILMAEGRKVALALIFDETARTPPAE